MIRRLFKNIKSNTYKYDVSALRCFIAISAFFLCGGILGAAAGGYVKGEAADTLCGFIQGYLSDINSKTPEAGSFIRVLRNTFVFPLSAFLLGTSVIGFLLLPPLAACRGFLLGFSAASVIRVFGSGGKLLIFASYGINALISIPCVFLIAIQAMQISGKLFASGIPGLKNSGISGKRLIIKPAMCCVIMFMTAILDTYLTPYLIRLAASIVV